MKHIIKVEVLENLPTIRPLIAMDRNKKFFQEGKKEAAGPADNEIWYWGEYYDLENVISVLGQQLPYKGKDIISNEKVGDKYVITFDGPITKLGANMESGEFYPVFINESILNIESNITRVEIPNSVTSIGDMAFYGCSSLASITIPNSVTSIGESAFWGVFNIEYHGSATGSPWGAKCVNGYVEGYLVYQDSTKTTLIACSRNAIGSIIIPDSVTSIGQDAFGNCSSLTSVTIGNNVTSIGQEAFRGCSSLTSVSIGNNVSSIELWAFEDCTSLTSVTINSNAIINPSDGPDYDSLSETFGSQVTEYIIGNSVTGIRDYAFDDCPGLTSVIIGDSVSYIGNYAFRDCSSLTSVTIPESVTSIGDYAFGYCVSLTSINIPDGVTDIGSYAFRSCDSLTSITIPNSVTSIGQYAFDETGIYANEDNWENDVLYINNCLIAAKRSISGAYDIKVGTRLIADGAFYYCTSLTSVTIPNSVTSIRYRAFQVCTSLTSVVIPNSVTSIEEYAFYDCKSLTSVVIPNSVTSIGNEAFTNVLNVEYHGSAAGSPWGAKCLNGYVEGNLVYQDSTKTTLIACRSTAADIIIPSSVTSIGKSAFSGCSSLTSITINSDAIVNKAYTMSSNLSKIFGSQVTEYIIGDNVKGIGSRAFYNCSSLTSVTIGNSVTSIGYGAFDGCSSLTSVTIGNSVTSIGDVAFSNCSSLKTITCEALTPPTIGYSTFYSTNNCPIYVPVESVDAYKAANNWSQYASRIKAIQ